MNKWQPIETAPKEKKLLFYNPPCYRQGHPKQQTHGAVIRVGYVGDWPNRKPTHWMPLPEPPAAVASPSLGAWDD